VETDEKYRQMLDDITDRIGAVESPGVIGEERALLFTEGIAYHEAAHMVVAWELGLSVAGATIVPDPEGYYQARVLVPVEDRVRYADWVDEHGYLYSHLVVRFAGPAASDKFTGVPTPPEAVDLSLGSPGSDHWSAADFILTLAGETLGEQEEVGSRAERHAANLVRARHSQIEAVAHALMERETLDGAECRQVLEGAFHDSR